MNKSIINDNTINNYKLAIYNYRFRDDVKYGSRHPRHNIHYLSDVKSIISQLPSKIDLSYLVKDIYDINDIKCSGSAAVCLALKIILNQKYKASFFNSKSIYDNISILYNYNLSRIYEESKLSDDDNSMIETCLQIIMEYKFCDAELLKYNILNKSTHPPLRCFENANLHKRLNFNYEKLSQDLKSIKMNLSQGYPVIVGIVIFESIYKCINGLLLTPNSDKEKILGSHVIVLIGYDDDKQTFKFVNCLGKNWGNNGFGYIMYDYITNNQIAGDIYSLKYLN